VVLYSLDLIDVSHFRHICDFLLTKNIPCIAYNYVHVALAWLIVLLVIAIKPKIFLRLPSCHFISYKGTKVTYFPKVHHLTLYQGLKWVSLPSLPMHLVLLFVSTPYCNTTLVHILLKHKVVLPVQISNVLYKILVSFDTPWWWSRVRPKHADGYHYVIKYILRKCILWFTVCYNLLHGYGTY
jgi:hypothetical protein